MANEVFALTYADVELASEEAIPYTKAMLSGEIDKDTIEHILKFYRAEILLRLTRKNINN